MYSLESLTPAMIWHYFGQILKIPRPSGREEKIREFLVDFAKEKKLAYRMDNVGNLLIYKPAHPDMRTAPIVCLQSHLDMVCEKNEAVDFDFGKDAIDAYIDGDWVKARGTTLGGDDGIGIAAQLAILADEKAVHGPLECLFTVEEETGLTGAFGLEPGFLSSTILLNLDSEDEGELFIGCAGGIDLTAWLSYERKPVPAGHIACRLGIRGLQGGHSGDDIHKGLGNANKILNRFLWENKSLELCIRRFEGGNLRNAIAREAWTLLTLPAEHSEHLKKRFTAFSETVKKEYYKTEPNLELYMSEEPLPEWVIDDNSQAHLLNSVYGCPHGVISWSQSIPGLVETSTNLAAVRFSEGLIKITTSQRSSVDSAKQDICNMVESVFLLAGAQTERSTGYPGWNPNPNSRILNVTAETYRELFGQSAKVKAIHAGLECGLFLEKYPDMDMISFGPTVKGAHSPDERLNIPTVEKFWRLLVEVLKRIN